MAHPINVLGETMTRKDERSLGKRLDAKLREADKALRTLSQVYRVMFGVKPSAKLGVIATHVYMNHPDAQRDSLLTRLPFEIMDAIVKVLDSPADSVALALTCKRNAAIIEEIKRSETTRSNPRTRIRDATRLMVLIRILEWMPQPYRICFSCLRYRPRIHKGSGSGWQGKSRMEFVVRRIDQSGLVVTASEFKRAQVEGSRCPMCVERARLSFLNDKAGYMNTFSELRKRLDGHKITATCTEVHKTAADIA